MKLALGIFVLLTALALSVVAAWFSIVGMVALFSASAVGVIAMMSGLEFGKLVASGVLKMNWSNPNFNRVLKSYLFISVGVLMLITSIGIYGYLSAGHLEQKAPLAGLEVKTGQIEVKVAQLDAENKRIEQRLDQIDKNIGVFLEHDQASKGLAASNRLSRERDELQAKLDENNEQINGLTEELVPLKMESSEVEAKLGPVKYVAALFGWDDTAAAVRLVILIIMFAFDPLAVVLMLSALIILKEWHTERRKPEDEAVEEIAISHSSGCVFNDLDTTCQNPTCRVCPEGIILYVSNIDPDPEETVEDEEEEMVNEWVQEPDHRAIVENEVIERQAARITQLQDELARAMEHAENITERAGEGFAQQANAIESIRAELKETQKELARREYSSREEYAIVDSQKQTIAAMMGEIQNLSNEIEGVRKKGEEDVSALSEYAQQLAGEAEIAKTERDHWKEVAGKEFQRAYELFEQNHQAEITAVAEAKEIDRETLLKLLEDNPSIVSEIEELVEGDVEMEMSDRQKLLDLLERNPAIINDMAEIFAGQITAPTPKDDGKGWLG